ncbi:ATP-binding protein [Streptomyces bambusae]|uniref:ATP-binding protein n=1 Tax=Streptomyces bambusae TaxID=1550616 RepID=UPI001CFD3D2B|nr:ATP-binding protein [Streptomyces bambusae]MCB5164235.1 ATP-binding protein [Streptomyces bambusae]
MAASERAPKRPGRAPQGVQPGVPRGAAEARRRVRTVLGEAAAAGGPDVGAAALTDALLVASELVSNAYRHGGGLTGFAVELDRAAVRITVSDASTELPHVAEPRTAGAHGGFGWPLVHLLSAEVTVTLLPGDGKRIRATVPLRTCPPGRPAPTRPGGGP